MTEDLSARLIALRSLLERLLTICLSPIFSPMWRLMSRAAAKKRHRLQRGYQHCGAHAVYNENCVWCSIANNTKALAEDWHVHHD